MADSKEELKSLLMRVKEESEKVGWKFNIQKMKITASSPITSWQIEEKKSENSDICDRFYFLGLQNHLEKAMATHSSTLAWNIPWMEEPGRPQSMGLLRVRHDWVTSLSLFTFHFHALEKEMAAHSSVLAWRIPGMGDPGGLPSLGSHRIGQD